MREALATEEKASSLARALSSASRAFVLARGVNYPTAHEIALKLKELALLSAEAFSSADFAHGPVALAERGLPALIVSPPGGVAARELRDLAARLRRRGSRVVAIGPRGESSLPLPKTPEILSPLVAVVPGQLLAFHLARSRKLDPENPRGLRKVTKTR